MAGYVELGDVRTWYDEQGEGKPLVLLHPGGADTRAWAPNLDTLAAHFHVFTPERRPRAHPGCRGPDHLPRLDEMPVGSRERWIRRQRRQRDD